MLKAKGTPENDCINFEAGGMPVNVRVPFHKNEKSLDEAFVLSVMTPVQDI